MLVEVRQDYLCEKLWLQNFEERPIIPPTDQFRVLKILHLEFVELRKVGVMIVYLKHEGEVV